MTRAIEEFDFNAAATLMYEFLWDELADWYVEVSKTRARDPVAAAQMRRVLVYVWDTSMRLLHPFMPFLTETLWQQLPHQGESIMISSWPQMQSAEDDSEQLLPVDDAAIAAFGRLQMLVRAIRNVRAEYNAEPGTSLATALCLCKDFHFHKIVKHVPFAFLLVFVHFFHICLQLLSVHCCCLDVTGKKIGAKIFVSTNTAEGKVLLDGLRSEVAALALLGRLDEAVVQIADMADAPAPGLDGDADSVHLVVVEGLEAFLPLADMVDYHKEVARLTKQADKIRKDVTGLESRLKSPGFIEKVFRPCPFPCNHN